MHFCSLSHSVCGPLLWRPWKLYCGRAGEEERSEGLWGGGEAAMGIERRDIWPLYQVQGQVWSPIPGSDLHPMCTWVSFFLPGPQSLMCTLGLLDEMVPENHSRPMDPWVHETPRLLSHLPCQDQAGVYLAWQPQGMLYSALLSSRHLS